jgi:hypothetical protein
MKLILLILAVPLLLSGCMTVSKFQGVVERVEGSGSVTASTPWFSGSCSVEKGRIEGDRYRADKIDLVINAYGGKVEVHAAPYSRPVVKDD